MKQTLNLQRLSMIATLAACVTVMAACAPTGDQSVPTLVEIPSAVAELPTQRPTSTRETEAIGAVATTPSTTTTEITSTPSTVEAEGNATSSGDSVTITPSLTITNTITPLPSPTASDTAVPDPLDELVQMALHATILPPQSSGSGLPIGTPFATTFYTSTPDMAGTQAATCPYPPSGGFGLLYATDLSLFQQLGCPAGSPPVNEVLAAAVQTFQYGFMVWTNDAPPYIYVFYQNQTYHRYLDTFVDGVDPVSGNETPPPGLIEPVRGFGKVWRSYPDVRNSLGWATAAEVGGNATSLDFNYGMLMYVDVRNDILVMVRSGQENGMWRATPGTP
ncbi:MAG TPA: hypothetical protein VHL11_05705 [Phototrophicaceae bacterium]|jgi:hypothetical protein|nr:hypothetical protein [Phototrophicaceae bacterium]